MTYEISGRSQTILTDQGKWGASLMIGGMIFGLAFALFYYYSLFSRANGSWLAVVAVLCGFAVPIGAVLLLIGREQRHTFIAIECR